MSKICVTISGPVASGKSSIGQLLAGELVKLGVDVDLCDRIDHPTGLSDSAYQGGIASARRNGVQIVFQHGKQ